MRWYWFEQTPDSRLGMVMVKNRVAYGFYVWGQPMKRTLTLRSAAQARKEDEERVIDYAPYWQ